MERIEMGRNALVAVVKMLQRLDRVQI